MSSDHVRIRTRRAAQAVVRLGAVLLLSSRPASAADLINNGTFEGGFVPDGNCDLAAAEPDGDQLPVGWTCFENFSSGVPEPSLISQFPANGPSLPGVNSVKFFRLDQCHQSGDWTTVEQVLNADVSACKDLTLKMDVMLVPIAGGGSHNLGGSGHVAGPCDATGFEYPATVKIDYTDTANNAKCWQYGWYEFAVTQENRTDACMSGFDGINANPDPTRSRQIAINVWVPNVFSLRTVLPNVARINKIRIGGSGWTFDAAVDNVQILCEQAQPGQRCAECGPGPHFIDQCGPFPPRGVDLVANNGAVLGIDVNNDCVRDFNLVLGPCPAPNNLLRIDKTRGPIDDSQNFPGASPINGHLDVIDTEMVSLCLTDGANTLVGGAGGPSAMPLLPSLGTIAEDEVTPDATKADSFFDVFFEASGVPGGPVYNLQPVRVRSRIDCLPPGANYFHLRPLCVPLSTRGTCSGGPRNGAPCVYDVNCPGGACVGRQVLGNLVSADHSVNQPVCDQGPFPQCGGNCPPDQVCQPNAAAGRCNCVPRPACAMGPYPECAGTCPAGQLCRTNSATGACGCFNKPACAQSPFPECGGTCPTGQICVPDSATGQCHCVAPPCEQSPYPSCSGTCPPGQTCVIDSATGRCRCVPPACDQGPFPTCGGTCPTGQVCQPNSVTGQCQCVVPPCDQGPFPTCGGICPTGQACQPNSVTGQCQCVVPPCDQSPYPTCGGPCPAGQVCQPDSGSGQCTCVTQCDQSPFPTCGGFCPAGQLCSADSSTGQCVCMPNCAQTPFPQCGGACPAGQACNLDTANNRCVCGPPPPCAQAHQPQCTGTGCNGTDVCRPEGTTCACGPPRCGESPFPQCEGGCPQGSYCSSVSGTACKCEPCPQLPPPQISPCHSGIPDFCLRWRPPDELYFIPPGCTTSFDVYRLTATRLPDSNGDGLADSYGACFQPNLTTPTLHETTPPPPAGAVHFYLVTGKNSYGEGTMGFNSRGMLRPNTTPCP